MPNRRNIYQYSLLAILGGLLCYFAYYCLSFSIEYFHYLPQADDYRLTQLHVMPFFAGEWEFKSLWGDVHPNPIHGVALIGSALFENMTFRSFPIVFFMFLVLKWIMLHRAFVSSMPSGGVAKLYPVFAVFSGFVFLSFNANQQYLWNSVAIANVYHAMGAVYLYLISKLVIDYKRAGLVGVLLFSLLFLITARQYAVPWIYASLAALMFVLVCARGSRRFSVVSIAVLVCALFLESGFYKLFEIELHLGSTFRDLVSSIRDNWGSRLDELILFSLTEYLLPIVYPTFLIKQAGMPLWVVMICLAIAGLVVTYAAALALMGATTNKRYLIPLIPLIFVAITILGTIAYRTNAQTDWLYGHALRYIPFRNVYIPAVVWILLTSHVEFAKLKILNMAMLAMFMAILLPLQFIHFQKESDFFASRIITQQRLAPELSFIYTAIAAQDSVSPSEINQEFKQQYNRDIYLRLGESSLIEGNQKLIVIRFLGENKLNLFYGPKE